jgi:hypothetical protein
LVEKVQVTIATKISDLIRRVRVKGNLTPEVTMNPRISVGGEQVGHGMTLGELDVSKDKKPVIIFTFDSA